MNDQFDPSAIHNIQHNNRGTKTCYCCQKEVTYSKYWKYRSGNLSTFCAECMTAYSKKERDTRRIKTIMGYVSNVVNVNPDLLLEI